jgi:hypothetical protein
VLGAESTLEAARASGNHQGNERCHQSGKSHLAKLPLLLLILSALNGCATVSTVPANSYCVIAKPITYDVTKDTSETAREIEAHNSVFVCLCENDCPKDK